MGTVGGGDDDLDPFVLGRPLIGFVELVEQLGVLRVARLRTVEDDARNVLGRRLVEDVLPLTHGLLLEHQPGWFTACEPPGRCACRRTPAGLSNGPCRSTSSCLPPRPWR